MLTIKNIELKIGGLLSALEAHGYFPTRALLFGSYAKGNPHAYSDLDVVIWAKGFTGNSLIDIEKIAPLLRPYNPIELHPFADGETADDNPFIEEIELTGKDYSYLLNTPYVTT